MIFSGRWMTKRSKLFFARGGYGSVHVVDYIDWHGFKTNPKWLIDSATLLFFIRTFTNVLTPLHFMRQCPSLPQNSDRAIKNIRDILLEKRSL